MQYTETKLAALAQEIIDICSERDSLRSQVDTLSPQVAVLQNQIDSNNANAQSMQSAFDTQHAQDVNMLNAANDARTADQQAAASVLNALQALFDQYRADHP